MVARRTEKPGFDFLTSVSDWFRPVDLSPGVGESFMWSIWPEK